MMIKPLTQITFDFAGIEEPGDPDPVTLTKSNDDPAKKSSPQNIQQKVKTETDVAAGKRGRRSLKETATHADLIQVPADDILFKKQYYSIGEVATMFGENQSLIRYWETEFDILQPKKNRKGDRFFRPVDVKNLVLIYDLLRRRKFTIEGAKEYLKKDKKAEEKFAMIQSLEKIKGFLMELKANL